MQRSRNMSCFVIFRFPSAAGSNQGPSQGGAGNSNFADDADDDLYS